MDKSHRSYNRVCSVALLGPTLCDPMDCSPPGKNPGVGCHFFLQGIFLTQGLNLHFLHWQVDFLASSHLGSP